MRILFVPASSAAALEKSRDAAEESCSIFFDYEGEGGAMDKRVISTEAQEFVRTIVRDRVGAKLSEDALKELATLYNQLTEGLEALGALDLSQVEPAVSFAVAEADQNED